MCDIRDDQAVISGVSGRYPECDDIYEFWEAIVNGVELKTIDDRRWPVGYMGLPPRSGKIKNLDKLDAQFFNLNENDADYMDPQIRLLFEVVYEAIIDAGVIPETLRGSNTAIAVGACYDDTSKTLTNDITRKEKKRVVIKQGPAAVSLAFGFTGPAFEVDTACASSFSALYEGMQLMKSGRCDQLVVGGIACHLTPNIARGFMGMKMIAADGRSKCLDSSVDGYCRSESVVAIFVQKRKDAKRIYASVINCETNSDGFKPEGITFPGYETQRALLKHTLDNSGVDPLSINYIEAHITGTAAGDPIESKAILESYRGDNPKPIMFGCLKSIMGHTEGASTNCGLTKLVLIFQKHCIPPNINYNTPNPNIEGLINGRIVPVLKKTEFHDEIIPLNSFGFGGVNVHALFKANEKVVSQDSFKIIDNIPRLVNISGRTEEGLEYAMNWIENNRKDVTKDFLALLNDVSKTPLENGMHCRAFMILNETTVVQKRVFRGATRRPLWFFFSALGCQWKAMAKELMSFPLFSKTIHKCSKVLKTVGIDLIDVLVNEHADIETNIINALTSIISIQLAIVDLLIFIGIKADGIMGHSVGEVAAGYADGCLTLEEAILTGYYIAKCSREWQKQKGAMAAVGISWDDALTRCPLDVYLACDNSDDGITVAGSNASITKFVKQLQSENIFAKCINSCDMAYHSPVVNECFDPLVAELNKVIKNPKRISRNWISTSQQNGNGVFCDALYFANNVVSPVMFRKATNTIPANSCVVEIGPSSILLPIIRRLKSNCQLVALMKRDCDNNLKNILSGIGEIYCTGNNINIENLYPKVEYPVPRETLSLSHLLKWDHSKSFFVPKFPEYFLVQRGSMVLDFASKEFKFIEGHCVDGRNLFPATGYLYFVWTQYANMSGESNPFDFPVEFINIKFSRATIIPKSGHVKLDISINKATGHFIVVEGGSECVSGTLFIPEDQFVSPNEIKIQNKEIENVKLKTEEIYKELRVRGYDYGSSFQGLVEANSVGSEGKAKWTGHWISFTDSLLHLSILALKERILRVPTGIDYMRCDPKILLKCVEKQESFDVFFDEDTNICSSNGVIIKGLKGTPILRRTDNQAATLLNQCFTPYNFNVKTSEKLIRSNAYYFGKCVEFLKRLETCNFEVTEDERKYLSNHDLNEDFAFYNKLVHCLKEKKNFADFLSNLSDCDKSTIIFKTNFKNLVHTQLKQILENIKQKVLKIVEYNATERKVKDVLIDLVNRYVMKYEFNSLPTQGNGKGVPASLKNLDLIVYKDSSTELIFDETCLKSSDELSSLMKSFYNSLRNGGFLLFAFRTKLTDLENELLNYQNINNVKFNEIEVIKKIASSLSFKIIAERSDDLGIVSLILKRIDANESPQFLKVGIEKYEWVEDLKQLMKNEKKEQSIWLMADRNDFSGVIGLTRCLKKEPGGDRIRCFVSDGQDITQEILDKDLIFNVIKNGSHGVYIYNEINEKEEVKEVEHSYLDVKTKGDLSSFRWYEAPHKNWSTLSKNEKTGTLVNLYYGTLNFKDVMVATGRIPLTAYPQSFHECGSIGMEYSGIDENGNRVMGLISINSLATSLVIGKKDVMWPVPDSWTLEQAATVPVVYLTVYYALLIRGKLLPKETVLIHAGSGGVGQAAIAVCLSMGCKIFTSVGTEKKRNFLKDLFPQLNDENFVNSRDLNFEEKILKETNGRGVDIVLNSLAEEKMRASINCLADFGRFIEIGKFDIIQNNTFDVSQFKRNQSFHGVCVAHLKETFCLMTQTNELKRLYKMFSESLKNGYIKPLQANVFSINEAEKAFRFMASGKHIGKVLLKIRDESEPFRKKFTVKSVSQTFCHPSKVYIIFGGLGGLGLELSMWLSYRGAKKLVLTSRTGIKDNYQRYIVNKIKENGVTVQVLVNDASTYNLTLSVINKAKQLGPIGGVFNLSMVLCDSLIENQTQETFKQVCKPKINTTLLVDQLTRKLCPKLDYFVCFSSAACGRGNVGQSNYGFANSVMESICEKRRADNLHAVAIQWGPIGDTGFFIDAFKSNDVIIQNFLPQRIPSFLNSLETLMNSSYSICFSAIHVSNTLSEKSVKGDLLKTICHILGVTDSSTLEDNTTLGDLGMDSLMAVEIKQGLERDYNTELSTHEIRQLSIKEIKEISAKRVVKKESTANNNDEYKDGNIFELPKQLFKQLDNGNQGVPIFFIPPVEGDFRLLHPLVKYMTRPVIAINWTQEVNEKATIEEVAAFYVNKLRETYQQTEYDFVAYSFGAFVAFEICLQLQAIDSRLVKKLILLDGDIPTMSSSSTHFIKLIEEKSEKDAYEELLLSFFKRSLSEEKVATLRKELNSVKSKEKQDQSLQLMNALFGYKFDANALATTIQCYFEKMRRAHLYKPSNLFKGTVKFVCSTTKTDMTFKFNDEGGYDNMKQLINGEIEFIPMTGDHVSFLTSNFEDIGNYLESQFYQIHS